MFPTFSLERNPLSSELLLVLPNIKPGAEFRGLWAESKHCVFKS